MKFWDRKLYGIVLCNFSITSFFSVSFQDGKKISSTEHMQLSYLKGICRLHIDRLTLEDEAEYLCEAKNEIGISNTAAEVLVESKRKYLNLSKLSNLKRDLSLFVQSVVPAESAAIAA